MKKKQKDSYVYQWYGKKLCELTLEERREYGRRIRNMDKDRKNPIRKMKRREYMKDRKEKNREYMREYMRKYRQDEEKAERLREANARYYHRTKGEDVPLQAVGRPCYDTIPE